MNKFHMKPFQIFDVLSKEDFEKVLCEKNNFLSTEKRGGITKKLNFTYSSDELGIFSKVCDRIKSTLISKGFVEPKITSIDFINHIDRNKMHFHKHSALPIINAYEEYIPPKDSKSPYAVPFEYFWVAIYYPHNLNDEEYYGKLIVRLKENVDGLEFKAIPNSLVLHNGHYGHEVEIKKLHPNIIRDSCFTHWVCEYKA